MAREVRDEPAVDHRPPKPVRFKAMPIAPCGGPMRRSRTPPHGVRYPRNETDLQAPKPEAREQAWISGAHEHQGGARHPEPPPPPRQTIARGAHRIQAGPLTAAVDAEHERLPRAARIRRTRDIRAVLRRGARESTPALDVFILRPPPRRPRGTAPRLPRVGWIVPKLGNRIVARNRVKRRLREIGRRRVLTHLRRAGCGADVLVRVRRSGYRATYGQLEEQWMSVVEKAC